MSDLFDLLSDIRLGTADVDVLIDLLDGVRLAGATRVELSLPASQPGS